MSLRFGASGSKVYNSTPKPKIVVIGVGGGGCNAVNNMIDAKISGVEFVVANTDAQALESSICESKIQLGLSITGGLGAGSVPEIGARAAEESTDEIMSYIKDANMVFVACGMGGGTGTGASPIIAKLAKERGILTIGVVTKPFKFEREKRMHAAEKGIAAMQKYCDTLIVIPNQNLFRIASENTTFKEAFEMADSVLVAGVRCITDLVTNPGLINLDFADVAAIMINMGRAVMGIGQAEGPDRAVRATEDAMVNPLLEESSIRGATGILINITGGPDVTLFEVNDVIDRITSEIDPQASVKFGSIISDDYVGTIKVSIVATGIESDSKTHEKNMHDDSVLENHKHDIYEHVANNTSQDVISEDFSYQRTEHFEYLNSSPSLSPSDTDFANDSGSSFGSFVPKESVTVSKKTSPQPHFFSNTIVDKDPDETSLIGKISNIFKK